MNIVHTVAQEWTVIQMNEYVSKEAMLKNLTTELEQHLNEGDPRTHLVIQRFIKYVEDFPTVDVSPVRCGRWIGVYEYCEAHNLRPSGLAVYHWCSECDKAEKKTSDFCPNCGARMDGGSYKNDI